MALYTHIALGTNNLEKARKFYDRVLEPFGCKRLGDGTRGSFYGTTRMEFMILTPLDEKPVAPSNGLTVRFAAPNRAAVDEFHARALAEGGKCEGPPGPRPKIGPTIYGAYVRDLDGNKLAAFSVSET